MAFRDDITIKVSAGRGGDGVIRFDKLEKPVGGIAGDGGDIYLKGSKSLFSLGHLHNKEAFRAKDGENGGGNNKTGADGDDYYISVPLKTIVNLEGKTIGEIDEDEQLLKVGSGGRGGLGNYYFRKGGWQTLRKRTEGKPGDKNIIHLQLELKSDVIFIGYPNAGKSSILNEITNADAKIAAYAFTTLLPQLGRVDDTILMDLPGLIEGTSEGKGVGTKFVKHTKSADHLTHFLSAENYQAEGVEGMITAYKTMWKELDTINSDMFNGKKEIVLITKSDLIEPEEREELKVKLEKELKRETMVVSLYGLDSLEALKEYFRGLK